MEAITRTHRVYSLPTQLAAHFLGCGMFSLFYGGTPAADRKYLLCMVGCYDHKTGMLRRPVVVCDKGVNNVRRSPA